MPSRLYNWLFPPKLKEKEAIVGQIEKENERLTSALDSLSEAARTVKKDKKKRDEITRLFDDALRAMNKESRK